MESEIRYAPGIRLKNWAHGIFVFFFSFWLASIGNYHRMWASLFVHVHMHIRKSHLNLIIAAEEKMKCQTAWTIFARSFSLSLCADTNPIEHMRMQIGQVGSGIHLLNKSLKLRCAQTQVYYLKFLIRKSLFVDTPESDQFMREFIQALFQFAFFFFCFFSVPIQS